MPTRLKLKISLICKKRNSRRAQHINFVIRRSSVAMMLPPGWPVSTTVGEPLTELDRFTPRAAAGASPFAGRPAAADDGGMAQAPGDERCKHGQIAAWCGESECMAARKGLPVRVWRTPYGSAYHRTPTCQALLEGQRMAERYGREVHPAESVPLAEAMSDMLGECFHCFPENVPPDAIPCQVLSGGVWVDGFLLEWQRGADGQRKGLVNYRHGASRRVALKDPADIRPAGSSKRL